LRRPILDRVVIFPLFLSLGVVEDLAGAAHTTFSKTRAAKLWSLLRLLSGVGQTFCRALSTANLHFRGPPYRPPRAGAFDECAFCVRLARMPLVPLRERAVFYLEISAFYSCC